MRSLVFTQADTRLRGVEVRQLFPVAQMIGFAGMLSALWIALAWWGSPLSNTVRDDLRVARAVVPGAPLAIARVDAIVTSPAYTGRPDTLFRNPDRIEALRGSSIQLSVRSNAVAMQLVTGADTVAFARDGDSFVTRSGVVDDGFFLLIATGSPVDDLVRRFIGVSAIPDASPRVRITDPGRDLFVPDSNRTIPVAIEAADDMALESLRLHYTKVSGSGERFTFIDGEVPVVIKRESRARWTATASLSLAELGLARGDMVVYRAVASDEQPGVPPTESDAFIVEVMSTSGDAVDGFAIDPEEDRYAVSQQMIIVKTEHLIERQGSMAREEVLDASRNLAIEQRRVRAEFVFMMGGELAEEIAHEASMDDLDESHHAEAEADLAAGRVVNPSRAAIFAAIRSMSRAMRALEGADLQTALTHERRAVEELEKAFSRTRYLLRAFSQREALDLNRRLTGNLSDAASFRAPQPQVRDITNAGKIRLRIVLEELQRADAFTNPRARYAELAEATLSIDPSSKELQHIAGQLARVGRGGVGNSAMVAARDSATRALSELVGETAGVMRSDAPLPELRVLEGRIRNAGQRQ